MLGVGAGLPCLDRERRAVPDLAGVDAAAGEFVMGRFDVGDDQPGLGRAGGGRGESGAESDRGRGARRRELDYAEAVQRGGVAVEPPAQALVELLGSVDVGDGDDLDLQVKIGLPDGRVAARAVYFGDADGWLVSGGRPQLVFVVVMSSRVICAPARRAW